MYISKPIPKVIKVKALDGYKIYLKYNDETKGTIDLSHLKNKGVFAWWDDADNFSKVYVDNSGAIAWNENLDIDSLNCYLKIINKTFEEYAGSQFFYGIIIYFYFEDHNPPHFHAKYNEFEALIDIETLGIVRGYLPSKAHSLVVEQGSKHKIALMNDWELAKASKQPEKIEPLK